MNNNYKEIEEKINYVFKDKSLLKLAFVHKSFNKNNNERLEFLGDGILDLIIGEELYKNFPEATEGQLTRARSYLVCGKMLAVLSKELKLGRFFALGSGEKKSGGFNLDSLHEDCLEALIGAVYLDSGNDINIIREKFLPFFKDKYQDARIAADTKDPKTALQEYMQKRGLNLPEYTILKSSGKPHNMYFEVQCFVENLNNKIVGSGSSRKRAELDAATKALTKIGV